MKDFVKWVGVFIALVVLSTLATVGAIKYMGDDILPLTCDSSAVVQMDMTSSNELTSLTDVFQLRQTMMDERRIDSTFLAIDDGTLSNVVAVLLKRAGTTTKDEIVNEYLAGRAVYDNLPPQGSTVQSDATTTQSTTITDPVANISLTKEGSTTVTEGPPTSVGDSKSPPSKDTVINGKHYKPVNQPYEESDCYYIRRP